MKAIYQTPQTKSECLTANVYILGVGSGNGPGTGSGGGSGSVG